MKPVCLAALASHLLPAASQPQWRRRLW